VIKTIGAAIGAAIMIFFLASVASKLTTHFEPNTQQSSLDARE